MNRRQELFCLEYAKSGNATKAAISAGYSQRTAGSIGQRLLKNVDIQNHLQEIQEEIDKDKIADISEIQAFWSDLFRDDAQRPTDRLKASELLAKTEGAFKGSMTGTPPQSSSIVEDWFYAVLASENSDEPPENSYK
ncbi:MAG: terminase small subunit [Oscillospiraceae bacterium]|nr:terminase small subunit [Oscillospiraceae bacterium]